MNSVRQELVDALIARLETLGFPVADWRLDWDDEELPAISVCDLIAVGESSNKNSGLQQRTLPVQIRIFAKTPLELRTIIADCLDAIRSDLYFKDSGGKSRVNATRLTKEGMVVPSDQFELGGAAIEIELDYFTANFSSYK